MLHWKNVKRLDPNMKIILAVRDPGCRVGSDYHHLQKKPRYQYPFIYICQLKIPKSQLLSQNLFLQYSKHFESCLKSFPSKSDFHYPK